MQGECCVQLANFTWKHKQAGLPYSKTWHFQFRWLLFPALKGFWKMVLHRWLTGSWKAAWNAVRKCQTYTQSLHLVSQTSGQLSAFLDGNTLTLGEQNGQPMVLSASCYERSTTAEHDFIWPVKSSIFTAFRSFYGSLRHIVGVLFLGICSISLSPSLNHPCLFLFVLAGPITPPLTQAYANSLCQSSLPYLYLISSFTFTSVTSTHPFQPFVPSSVFSHLFFASPSISFPPLFTHLSPISVQPSCCSFWAYH